VIVLNRFWWTSLVRFKPVWSIKTNHLAIKNVQFRIVVLYHRWLKK